MSSNPMKRGPLSAKKPQSSAHVHLLVAKTAQGMAREMFDSLMSGKGGNEVFAMWRQYFPEGTPTKTLEEEFVRRVWGSLIEQARATLAYALTQPIDDVLKEEISDALILDKQLVRGRANPSKVLAAS